MWQKRCEKRKQKLACKAVWPHLFFSIASSLLDPTFFSIASSLLDPKGKYGFLRMRSLLDRRCMDGH